MNNINIGDTFKHIKLNTEITILQKLEKNKFLVIGSRGEFKIRESLLRTSYIKKDK